MSFIIHIPPSSMQFKFAWRYFKAKKSTNAVNIIAMVSVVAIAVGAAALVLVLSAFNGFEGLVKSLYSTFYTDIKVSPASGKTMVLTAEQLQQLRKVPGVKNFSLVIEEKAWLQNGESQAFAILKGVDSEYAQVAGVANHIIKGTFQLGNEDQPAAVLGIGIENALGIESDRSLLPLTVYLPKKGATNILNPGQSLSTDNIATAGSFLIQQDFDNKYVITNLAFMKRMLGLAENEYGAMEITLARADDAEKLQQSLQTILGKNYKVLTRYEQNRSLYSVMRLEKWTTFAILCLILIVAAFNMVGALTMLVLEKQKDIHVLKAMGASNGYIQKIFLSEGLLLAIIGGASGIVLSLLLCYLQIEFHLFKLQGTSFVIDYYPVKVLYSDILLVAATILIVAVTASWIPARKAAREAIQLRT
jgi:lipoprotein-releasing system permease protein